MQLCRLHMRAQKSVTTDTGSAAKYAAVRIKRRTTDTGIAKPGRKARRRTAAERETHEDASGPSQRSSGHPQEQTFEERIASLRALQDAVDRAGKAFEEALHTASSDRAAADKLAEHLIESQGAYFDFLYTQGVPAGYRELSAPTTTPQDPEIAADWLTYYAARYHETRNPVFAWVAINTAIRAQVFFPEWMTAYLARVSGAVSLMVREMIPRDDLATAFYRALEFPSVHGVNPFRALIDAAHDFSVVLDVAQRVREGSKPQFAFVDVAREHPARCAGRPKCDTISETTVARLWRKHRGHLMKPKSIAGA